MDFLQGEVLQHNRTNAQLELYIIPVTTINNGAIQTDDHNQRENLITAENKLTIHRAATRRTTIKNRNIQSQRIQSRNTQSHNTCNHDMQSQYIRTSIMLHIAHVEPMAVALKHHNNNFNERCKTHYYAFSSTNKLQKHL